MNREKYYEYKDLIEAHILDFLPEIDPKSIVLYDAMKYSLTAGGKRIRPTLTLAACEFVGGDVKLAIPFACAVEYVHTYSLIHDDLPSMDDDVLRKGIPTNHIEFGEANAILAGDGLLTTAFETMTKDMLLYFDEPKRLRRRIRACYDIAKGAGCRGMVAGQVTDIEAMGHECSKELLEYIHVNKTGELISAAVRAGAHIGGATDAELSDLTTYGEYLGLAFQIRDDILDVCGTEEELGKKPGKDAEKHKITYVSIHGLDASNKYLEELSANAKRALEKYGEKGEFLMSLADFLAVREK